MTYPLKSETPNSNPYKIYLIKLPKMVVRSFIVVLFIIFELTDSALILPGKHPDPEAIANELHKFQKTWYIKYIMILINQKYNQPKNATTHQFCSKKKVSKAQKNRVPACGSQELHLWTGVVETPVCLIKKLNNNQEKIILIKYHRSKIR